MVGSYFEQTAADVYRMYERELLRMNAMDFDDLLVRAVNVLELFPEVRERYTTAFRHVLVDEYQDTNHAQYRWLQLLAGERRNLAVVGDPDQSIYQFRGADIRNILEFEDDFPDAQVVRLEQNYRSTQTILDAANAVISNNRGRKSKLLWTDLGQGDPIKLRELDDEHAEARFVTGEIQRLVDEGVSRSEIAVFYRTNAQSRVLQDTLVRAEIAYQVIGGTKFYERAEIKDAIAYLTVLVNPQDVGAFTRIVNSPRRGIGSTSLSRVLAFANTMGISIWDAASEPEQVPGLGAAAIKALKRFMATMHILRERVESGSPLAELLKETLRETGYLEALEAERTIEAQGRIENLEELVNVAAESAGADSGGESAGADSPEAGSLPDFLQQLALVSDSDDRTDSEGLVTLMTLHNAKGLEFPVVFLSGMELGLFPHSRSMDSEEALEEERRLCYVGMTRARKRLILTWAKYRRRFGGGEQERSTPSWFLGEVPEHLIQNLGPQDQAGEVNLQAERHDVRQSAKRNTYTGKTYNSIENISQFFGDRGMPFNAGNQGGAAKAAPSPSLKTPPTPIPRPGMGVKPPLTKQLPPAPPRKGARAGMTVEHPKYGLGTVVRREGDGEDAKITVNFPRYGLKKLLEKYAGLKRN
jgi:DNA helicase-2/ATP-dependent DNA helicase PcrA